MHFGSMVITSGIWSINVMLYSFFHTEFSDQDKNPNSFQVLCF